MHELFAFNETHSSTDREWISSSPLRYFSKHRQAHTQPLPTLLEIRQVLPPSFRIARRLAPVIHVENAKVAAWSMTILQDAYSATFMANNVPTLKVRHLASGNLYKTRSLWRSREGSSSAFEPILARTKPEEHTKPAGASIRHVSINDSFLLLPDESTEHYEDEEEDLDSIEALVHPHGKALINIYFRIIHPSFPILHKKVYLEKYNRTHREFSPALLAAVYLLALEFWSYSTELSSHKKPDVAALEVLAFKTIGYVIHRPKISTVEAGLLLLQKPKGNAWALTCTMVAVGQDLGLHLDCTDWKIPSWEKGLRKRLAWALYAQDTWASLVHGRPAHISASNWAVTSMAKHDFPENAADDDDEEGSTEVEKGRLLFCHMISLAQILADILTSLYSVEAEQGFRAAGISATRSALAKAKPLQIRLREWFTDLPDSLSIEDVKVRKLSSTGYLHLAYYATEITLHRRLIRTLSTSTDLELMSVCRNAANARLTSTVGFINKLRPEHLQSFWYFSSKYSFALVGLFQGLLAATAQSKDEERYYMTSLAEYRWVLRVSSKSVDFLEQSLAMIEICTHELGSRCQDGSKQMDEGELNGDTRTSPLQSPFSNSLQDEFESLQDLDFSDEAISAFLGHSADDISSFPIDSL
ncbi:MAG: hypothetical protein Q9220_005294 [cf. Caloplaca sp. 1 TL-2023]